MLKVAVIVRSDEDVLLCRTEAEGVGR